MTLPINFDPSAPIIDSETLDLLDQSAERFARPAVERARNIRNRDETFDREVWLAICAEQWSSMLIPASMGGVNLGIRASARVARRLGAAAFPEPFVTSGVFASLLLARTRAFSKEHDDFSDILAGKRVVAVAWQNEHGSLDLADVPFSCSKIGTLWQLDGRASFVITPSADLFIVVARGADGPAIFLLARDQPGLELSSSRAADGQLLGTVSISGTIPAETLLASGQTAEAAFAEAFDALQVCGGAELLGTVDRMLDLTVNYLRERQQFGAPLSSYQALQHRAVDMLMQRELADAALTSVSHRWDSGTLDVQERGALSSGVKARVALAAQFVAKHAIQLHGAIGTTDEYELGIHVNRSLVRAALNGDARSHLRRFDTLHRRHSL